MLILSYGIPKSGSTFAFLLIRDLLVRNGYDQDEIRAAYFPEEWRSEFLHLSDGMVDELSSRVPKDIPLVIKTHSPMYYDTYLGLNDNSIKAIATYREPKDLVLSLIDAGFKERQKNPDEAEPTFSKIFGVEDALEIVKSSYKVGQNWLFHPAVHKLSYSNLVNDQHRIMSEIVKFLNLDEEFPEILDYYARNRQEIKWFNKGIVNRWKAEMSEVDVDLCDREMSAVPMPGAAENKRPSAGEWIEPADGLRPLSSLRSYGVTESSYLQVSGWGDPISVHHEVYRWSLKAHASLRFYLAINSVCQKVTLKFYTNGLRKLSISLNRSEIAMLTIESAEPIALDISVDSRVFNYGRMNLLTLNVLNVNEDDVLNSVTDSVALSWIMIG